MQSSIGVCPYYGCTQRLPAPAAGSSCACELKQAVTLCGVCGMENRAAARFCRRCRAEIQLPTGWDPETAAGPASFLTLAGTYRRPPLTANNAVYGVNLEGCLETAFLSEGARSRTLAELPAAAACNRGALVNVAAMGKSRPRWTFLGVHPGGVEAVILNTGQVHTLHGARGGAELAVNAAGSSAGFRGVASDGNIFAFVERAGPSQVTLAIRSLVDEHPANRTLTLAGREAIGPVLHGGMVVLSSNEEIGAYDIANQTADKARLPQNFEPLLARRQDGLNIPAGSIPLTVERLAKGPVAYIAGMQGGLFGLLAVELKTGATSFDVLGRGGSLTSNADGSLCVAAEGELRVVGNGAQVRERSLLQFRMPAIFDAPFLVSFTEATRAEARPGAHRLTLTVPGKGKVSELGFEDGMCSEVSCGGAVVTGTGLAVPYFDAGGPGGSGLKLAYWNFGL